MTTVPQETTDVLSVLTAERAVRPRHPGRARRALARLASVPARAIDAVDDSGHFLQKAANTLRFERFWRDKVYGDARVVVVPRFDKKIGKRPIWNVAINWISKEGAEGTVLEFGTNNGGWLHYFASRLPSVHFVGFDCFEGLPEAWDSLPAGSIKGYGMPIELWSDDPERKTQVLAEFNRSGHFPKPPQPNVSIEVGLFSESLPRYLRNGWPTDLRLVHFDADLYISTRPVLDTLCGPLKYKYLALFDEFYSVNHEFRAWREFTALFRIVDWRVVAASEDGAQVLIEVNSGAPVGRPADLPEHG
jgi:hypothetical protein